MNITVRLVHDRDGDFYVAALTNDRSTGHPLVEAARRNKVAAVTALLREIDPKIVAEWLVKRDSLCLLLDDEAGP